MCHMYVCMFLQKFFKNKKKCEKQETEIENKMK